jgi:uncharacterized membrane protein YfcA
MTVELALLVVIAGTVSGILIGTVGIGGVLLVPALVLFGGAWALKRRRPSPR